MSELHRTAQKPDEALANAELSAHSLPRVARRDAHLAQTATLNITWCDDVKESTPQASATSASPQQLNACDADAQLDDAWLFDGGELSLLVKSVRSLLLLLNHSLRAASCVSCQPSLRPHSPRSSFAVASSTPTEHEELGTSSSELYDLSDFICSEALRAKSLSESDDDSHFGDTNVHVILEIGN